MRRSLRTTVVALSAASSLAFLEIFRTTLSRVIEGNPMTGYELLHRLIPTWIGAVIASPWCAFMAWRFPFRAGRTARALLAHLGGALGFGAIHVTLMMAYHAFRSDRIDLPPAPILIHTYFFYAGMEMSLYGAIVVVLLLLESRRETAEREIAAARLAESAISARLESLRAQIRPHFLFNTLNALAVLARRGDGAAVDRAIADLGDLLRASFDTPGRHEIPLGEELAFAERYVSLQRLRFPDRLVVEWAVAEETRAALVPALLVQPLVENALEHGLGTAGGGRVRVAARRDSGVLEVEVSDDGPGFAGAATGAGRGVGLANTHERLTLLHGERASLQCLDRPEGGGVVRIRLPWRVASAEPAA